MSRKKRYDSNPRTPGAPADRPDQADPRETPFQAQAAPTPDAEPSDAKPSEDEGAPRSAAEQAPAEQASEEQAPAEKAGDQAAAEPVAPTPAAADAERGEAAPEPQSVPVAATPWTQRSEDAAPDRESDRATPPTPAAPPRSGVSAGGAFMLGLLAALLVAGLAVAAAWTQRDQLQAMLAPAAAPVADDARIGAVEGRAAQTGERVEQLAGRIDGIEQAVGALRDDLARLQQQAPVAANGAPAGVDPARLDQLEQRLQAAEAAAQAAPAVDPARLDQLAQRLQTVEGAPRVEPAQVAALDQGVQRLDQGVQRIGQEVARIEEGLAALAKQSADAASVLRLSERVEAAETAVRQAEARVNTAQNLLLAVGQLREAAYRGDSFDAELRAVGIIAGNDPQVQPALESLAPHAQRGVATRTALAARFDELAGSIVRADFGPEADGWMRETVQRLASVVTVRRTEGDIAGDSAAAITGRAGAALEKGNLAGAVQELQALQGPAAQVVAPWLQAAQARLAAESALSDLTAHVVALNKASG